MMNEVDYFDYHMMYGWVAFVISLRILPKVSQ